MKLANNFSIFATVMMKKVFILLIIALSGVGFFSACDSGFDVASDWKEISIVFGLLDFSKDAQYIKIQKAFLSENTSALEMAKVGDSLFYANILNPVLEEYQVYIELYPDKSVKKVSYNTKTGTFPLEKVNALDEGFVKDTGLFAQNPYYIYKTTEHLDPSKGYRLVFNTPQGKTIQAETILVNDFNPFTLDAENNTLNLKQDVTINWKESQNAYIYELDMYFVYKETYVDGSETQYKTIKWEVFNNYVGADNKLANNSTVQFNMSAEAFYDFLADRIHRRPQCEKKICRLGGF